MNTTRICSALVISALIVLAVFAAPVAAAGASFSQLNSFSRLNGYSSGTGTGPVIPATSDVPEDILPKDPLSARIFSSASHNLGSLTVQPINPDDYISPVLPAESSNGSPRFTWKDLFTPAPSSCGCGGCS